MQLLDTSGDVSRSARRVCVNADVFKQCKISAGDVLAILPPINSGTEVTQRSSVWKSSSDRDYSQAFSVGVAWPAIDLPPQSS